MEDYSVFFKDEPSQYVWLPVSKLSRDYVCVQLMGYPAEGQSRMAFWVASDGKRTMVYFTNGLAEVLSNMNVTIIGVKGARISRIVDGRLQYMMDEESPWKDLGPVSTEGVRPSDPDFESTRRMHLKDKANAVYDEEERKQIKRAMKHDFWGKGGGF